MTISYHMPLQNKVRRLYFIFCMFYVAARAFVKEQFLTYELQPQHQLNNCLFIPLSEPSVANAISLRLEIQTPASHLYGTSRMPSVEPVSRKRTRKVGPGRFNPTMP